MRIELSVIKNRDEEIKYYAEHYNLVLKRYSVLITPYDQNNNILTPKGLSFDDIEDVVTRCGMEILSPSKEFVYPSCDVVPNHIGNLSSSISSIVNNTSYPLFGLKEACETLEKKRLELLNISQYKDYDDFKEMMKPGSTKKEKVE